jgi:hypothetical protein
LTSSLVGPTVEGVPLDYRGCNLRAECRASQRPVNVGNPGGCSSTRLPRGRSRAIHPRVVVAVAGGVAARLVSGVMRWRRSRRVAPGRTARAAFSMLPPDVQAVITAPFERKSTRSRPARTSVFDRRWMGERRSKGRPERTGRRCAERRRPEPERSWTRRGSSRPLRPRDLLRRRA